MQDFIFTSWNSILRITLITVFAYGLIIISLRFSGNRTLSKINAFDFIVTIALGSILANLILDKNTPLLEGFYAFSLLVLLQTFVSFLSTRSKAVKNVVTSRPSMLMYQGNFLKETMDRERISKSEILSAVREKGVGDLNTVEVIVLESNGNLSVITETTNANNEIVMDVKYGKQ